MTVFSIILLRKNVVKEICLLLSSPDNNIMDKLAVRTALKVKYIIISCCNDSPEE